MASIQSNFSVPKTAEELYTFVRKVHNQKIAVEEIPDEELQPLLFKITKYEPSLAERVCSLFRTSPHIAVKNTLEKELEERGNTPYHRAALSGNTTMLESLDARYPEEIETICHITGDIKRSKLLLKKNKADKTPLSLWATLQNLPRAHAKYFIDRTVYPKEVPALTLAKMGHHDVLISFAKKFPSIITKKLIDTALKANHTRLAKNLLLLAITEDKEFKLKYPIREKTLLITQTNLRTFIREAEDSSTLRMAIALYHHQEDKEVEDPALFPLVFHWINPKLDPAHFTLPTPTHPTSSPPENPSLQGYLTLFDKIDWKKIPKETLLDDNGTVLNPIQLRQRLKNILLFAERDRELKIYYQWNLLALKEEVDTTLVELAVGGFDGQGGHCDWRWKGDAVDLYDKLYNEGGATPEKAVRAQLAKMRRALASTEVMFELQNRAGLAKPLIDVHYVDWTIATVGFRKNIPGFELARKDRVLEDDVYGKYLLQNGAAAKQLFDKINTPLRNFNALLDHLNNPKTLKQRQRSELNEWLSQTSEAGQFKDSDEWLEVRADFVLALRDENSELRQGIDAAIKQSKTAIKPPPINWEIFNEELQNDKNDLSTLEDAKKALDCLLPACRDRPQLRVFINDVKTYAQKEWLGAIKTYLKEHNPEALIAKLAEKKQLASFNRVLPFQLRETDIKKWTQDQDIDTLMDLLLEAQEKAKRYEFVDYLYEKTEEGETTPYYTPIAAYLLLKEARVIKGI